MAGIAYLILLGALAIVMAMRRAPLWLWTAAGAVALIIWQSGIVAGTTWFIWPVFWAHRLAGCCCHGVVQCALAASPVDGGASVCDHPRRPAKSVRHGNAGARGGNGRLRCGTLRRRPDLERLRRVPAIQLSDEEKAFLEGRPKSCAA